ncbi:MAG: hypothetical protein IPK80_27580 [Nannocystis sp.]|nr:hypothetical protein [Nannocystis sp.]
MRETTKLLKSGLFERNSGYGTCGRVWAVGLAWVMVMGCDAQEMVDVEDEGAVVVAEEDLRAGEVREGGAPGAGETPVQEGMVEDGDVAPQEVKSGWTPWTSEEGPPVVCDPGSVLTGFGCSGGKCDNVRLHCTAANVPALHTYWTPYFSEEGGGFGGCPINSRVTGIVCQGGNCDKISLQCTSTFSGVYFPKVPINCWWTGWVSEENGGTLWLNAGWKVRGVQCSGSRCDNKRFQICDV